MAGLLDLFSSDDPQQQGLLAAAAGILGASGPSRTPHSFGQSLGAGYASFQAGRQQALDRQKEMLQQKMLEQQVAQATRKNELINQFLAANIGSAPDAGQGTAPVLAQSAGQSPAAPVSSSGAGFGGVPSAAIAADLAFKNGENIGGWINDRTKPTDFLRMVKEAGIDPDSTLGKQILQQHIAKENNIPLVAGRAGAPMYNPDGTIAAMAPVIPKNAVPTIVNGKVIGVSPLDGAAQVEQINAYADQAGKNQAEPIAGFDASGNPVYGNKLDAARGGVPVGGQRGSKEPMPGDPGFDVRHMSPTQKQAFYKQAEAQFGLRPGLAPGVEKSISGNVDTMNSDFSDLYAANKNAPVTLALLDNIKKLAPAAITGNNSDKLAYMNGLLTLGGFQKAKTVAEATDLLNKNANMLAINMRLGASGGGSDALQALAQAANPNSHMQPEAIIKAADEVAGQVRMRQAQYEQLLPYKMKNDVQGYYGAQQQFASKADPRTYQPDAQQPQAAPQAKPTAQQKFDMLPPAAQFDGKRMRADNGTIYRSVGGKWVKEQ